MGEPLRQHPERGPGTIIEKGEAAFRRASFLEHSDFAPLVKKNDKREVVNLRLSALSYDLLLSRPLEKSEDFGEVAYWLDIVHKRWDDPEYLYSNLVVYTSDPQNIYSLDSAQKGEPVEPMDVRHLELYLDSAAFTEPPDLED